MIFNEWGIFIWCVHWIFQFWHIRAGPSADQHDANIAQALSLYKLTEDGRNRFVIQDERKLKRPGLFKLFAIYVEPGDEM